MRLAFTAVWSEFDRRFRCLQLRPRGHHLRLRLGARLLDLLQALDVRLLGLAHARLHLAAGVERHRQPPGHRAGLRPVETGRVVEALGVVGLQLRRRQQLAAHQVDAVARRLLAVERSHHTRALVQGDVDVLAHRLGHQAAGARLHQVARRMADHALEGGPRRLQVGAREIERGHRGSAAGLRLRHVGARDFADIEAILGGAQIARQHRDVVLAQAHDGRVAHHVAEGRHRLQQHALLGQPQRLAPGAHGRLRRVDRVDGAEAAKQRLHHADRVAARVAVAAGDGAGVGGDVPVGAVGAACDAGSVTRQRARHLLVDRPQRRPRRVQPRIELVGRRQRLQQRLRASWGDSDKRARQDAASAAAQDCPVRAASPRLSAIPTCPLDFTPPDACTNPLALRPHPVSGLLLGCGGDDVDDSSSPLVISQPAPRGTKRTRAAGDFRLALPTFNT